MVNDVYQGGTHFNDTRIFGPMFYKGELLGFAQANGHWADVGGAVPGSFNVSALDHMAEGLRITPVRVYREGVYLSDVAELIANNTRAPADIIGDLQAKRKRVASPSGKCSAFATNTASTSSSNHSPRSRTTSRR